MRTNEAMAAERACCIMESEDPLGRPQVNVPALAAQGVTVSYNGRPAVVDVSLGFPHRRITALVGPSGSGKSTLLHSFNRMHETVEGCRLVGDICFAGRSIFAQGIDVATLRLRIGLIFQRPTPFPLSIRANIALGLREHTTLPRDEIEDRVVSALKQVGLWSEVADRLGSSALSLSGGQQQRLCLARALALEPEVILLDEPCSALDPIASGVVEDLISSLRDRYSIVIVTHNLAQAKRIADHTAVLWNIDGVGRLIEYGTTAQIFNAPDHSLTSAYVEGRRG